VGTGRPPVGERIPEAIERPGGQAHDIYGWFKRRLIEYRFLPGQQLFVTELADQLRVSATPVRETLIRLQAEGFLSPAPKRGFFVRKLALKDMQDLQEVRFLLLKHAIEWHATLVDACPEPAQIVSHDSAKVHDHSSAPLDGASDKAQRLAALADSAYEEFVRRTGNDTVVATMRNANERTQYLFAIELEQPGRYADVIRNRDSLFALVLRREFGVASGTVDREFNERMNMLPDLVKEANGRLFSSVPFRR
jgi:DNA-binding GntR family transcriptional regulator